MGSFLRQWNPRGDTGDGRARLGQDVVGFVGISRLLRCIGAGVAHIMPIGNRQIADWKVRVGSFLRLRNPRGDTGDG